METMSGLDGLGWPNPEDEPKPTTMNDTPETDAAIRRKAATYGMIGKYVRADFARKLERELTAVTEQRDKAWQKIENQAERITYLEGATNHATGTPLSKAIEQRDAVTLRLGNTQERMFDAEMQRDRLAEALKLVAEGSLCCACRGSAELVSIADEALNQLNL
jgi:alkylated DNA nucleotide flippase Atl1